MSQEFNYRHLYYFWVVAKEGGMARAAGRLGMAVQTVSTQVRELEQSLGHALLKPAGRGLVLTEAGLAAMHQADQIFALGEQLPGVVRDAAVAPGVRLAVGISEGLPKLAVRRLLQPVIDTPRLRLLCHEDEFDDLLGDLALHRLDVVLADRAAPPNRNLRLYSHPLGSSSLVWYAPLSLLAAAREGFPQSLAKLPVLLPTAHAAVRGRIDQWFERLGIAPNIVGEFEDHAAPVGHRAMSRLEAASHRQAGGAPAEGGGRGKKTPPLPPFRSECLMAAKARVFAAHEHSATKRLTSLE